MKRLHLICTAHIDPVWQWTWDEGISAALATFKSAVNLSEDFDYIFCHNEALLYQAVEENCPDLFEKIRELVKKGKWKIIGGWYIQPDCLMPSGESFVRQIKVGQEYFLEKFGVKPTVGINFDSFGHSIGLVQIMAKCGYKGYIHSRPFRWQINYPEGHFHKWIAPSGDSLIETGGLPYGSVMGRATEKIEGVAENSEQVDYVLWGVGNHGGGPSRKDLSDIKTLKIDGTEIIHSTPENLFSDDIKVPSEIRRSLVTCMAGCYSSMARVKKSHREAENLLYSTEKMLAVAVMNGYKADFSALKEAQKKLLLAEFHDILPGSCTADGETEGLELLSYCKKAAKDYRAKAFNYLTLSEPKANDGEFPIFVFNPMPYAIKTPVEAEFIMPAQNWSKEFCFTPKLYSEGKEIDCQEIKEESTINLDWRKKITFVGNLKPLTLTRFSVYLEKTPYREKFGKPCVSADLHGFIKDTVLKNPVSLEMFSDTADPWGMSKEEQKCMGTNPVPFDLMTEDECKKFIASDDKFYPVHLIEDGKVLKAIECFCIKDNSKAVIEYKKYEGLPYTDIKVTVEFAEKNKLVKLKVPVPEGIAVGDGPFVIEEKPENSELSFQKWLGIKGKDGNIFAVINDGIYGGTVKDGYLYLTMLRGSAYCTHPIPLSEEDASDEIRKLYPTDRYLPRIDNGRYVYNLRVATGSVEEITRLSEEFNAKPYAINIFPIGEKTGKEIVSVSEKVVMPTFKVADDGGYIFRFFNPELKDKSFNLTVEDKTLSVQMKRAEVLSVRYKDGKFEIIKDDMPV